ncbi:MAG: hydrogenase expression/formation C-terminal domain-containing protein [Gammaproteobacteria bacterium]
MSVFKDIPIKLEFTNTPVSLLLPILNEMLSKLETLNSSGQSSILDLRHEPLTLEDIKDLRALLGYGEVDASLNTLGNTNICETAVAGIWWITHYNEKGDVTSEFVEITHCPELMKTVPDELPAALTVLKDKIQKYTHRSTPEQVANRLKELGFGTGTPNIN